MRGEWLIVFVCACGGEPPNPHAPTSSAPSCGAEDATVKARIAFARAGTTENWLEVITEGPSCNALAACRRLAAREAAHALPPGFSASLQRPCRASAGSEESAISSLPYELVESEAAESDDASVRARYAWIERFAGADACEASREAHEERRRSEALEMRKALGAAAASERATASELACRRVSSTNE